MKRRTTLNFKLCALFAVLLLCACSDEYNKCVDKSEQVIICPPDGTSRHVPAHEREKYPEATDGLCEQQDEDASLTDQAVFHTTNVIFVTVVKLKWSLPSRWTACGIIE